MLHSKLQKFWDGFIFKEQTLFLQLFWGILCGMYSQMLAYPKCLAALQKNSHTKNIFGYHTQEQNISYRLWLTRLRRQIAPSENDRPKGQASEDPERIPYWGPSRSSASSEQVCPLIGSSTYEGVEMILILEWWASVQEQMTPQFLSVVWFRT